MMIDALARSLWCEMLRLDGVERRLWRRFLLRKVVHEVPESLQPVPDGLSPRYVEIGRRLNRDLLGARLGIGSEAFSPLLVAVDALVQDEISQALLNEHGLLTIATAP